MPTLDFSKLKNISRTTMPVEATNNNGNKDRPSKDKNLTTGHTDALNGKIYSLFDKEKELQDKTRAMYAKYQKNTFEGERLMSDITKGIQAGENVDALLLKAVEAISMFVGDPSYYKTNRETLQTVGGALGRDVPIKDELQEVESRMQRLQEALKEETHAGHICRLERSIIEHQKLIANLKKRLK